MLVIVLVILLLLATVVGAMMLHDGVNRTDYDDDRPVLLRSWRFTIGTTTLFNFSFVRVCLLICVVCLPLSVSMLSVLGSPGDTHLAALFTFFPVDVRAKVEVLLPVEGWSGLERSLSNGDQLLGAHITRTPVSSQSTLWLVMTLVVTTALSVIGTINS